MSKNKYFYVLLSSAFKPKVVKAKQTCQSYAAKHSDLSIHAFLTMAEAEKFISDNINNIDRLLPPKKRTSYRGELNEQEIISFWNKKLPSNSNKTSNETVEDKTNSEKTIEETSQKDTNEQSKAQATSEKDTKTDNFEEQLQSLNEQIQHIKIEELPPAKFDHYYFYKEDAEKIARLRCDIKPSQKYHLFFDGASKGNPGPSGAGYLIVNDQSQKVYSNSLYVGQKTNNVAEYLGMLYGVKSAVNIGIKRLNVYGDSGLVINQMLGSFRVKSEHLLRYYQEAKSLEKNFDKIDYFHIERESNTRADSLANAGVSKFRKPKPNLQ